MKKFVGCSLILVCLCVFLLSCQSTDNKLSHEKTRIVLVSPSFSSFKSFLYLIDKKIIAVPNLEVTGVIYARSNNDLDKIQKLLQEKDYPYIHMQEIDGDLDQNDLFQENSCSKKFHELFKNSDGILFFGGDDLPPLTYQHKTSLLTDVRNLHRHFFEISFLFHLLGGSQNESFRPFLDEKPNYVVFGFCLGLQTMNVATGGTLYQDIPHEIYGSEYVEDVLNFEEDQRHKNYWYNLLPTDDLDEDQLHRIQFVKERFFVRELKSSPDEHPLVCSSHHQAIKEIGKGFEIAATSLDGKVIEAIAHQKYKNVLGVQFHPELFELYSPEAKKYKRTPKDTELLSKYEIVKLQQSLQFHQNFWKHFNELFE